MNLLSLAPAAVLFLIMGFIKWIKIESQFTKEDFEKYKEIK